MALISETVTWSGLQVLLSAATLARSGGTLAVLLHGASQTVVILGMATRITMSILTTTRSSFTAMTTRQAVVLVAMAASHLLVIFGARMSGTTSTTTGRLLVAPN